MFLVSLLCMVITVSTFAESFNAYGIEANDTRNIQKDNRHHYRNHHSCSCYQYGSAYPDDNHDNLIITRYVLILLNQIEHLDDILMLNKLISLTYIMSTVKCVQIR